MESVDAFRIAIHEAAHAIASFELGGHVPLRLTIEADADYRGKVSYRQRLVPEKPSPWRGLPMPLWADLVARLAGAAAERLEFGDTFRAAEDEDRQHVVKALLNHGVDADSVRLALLDYLRAEAEEFVKRRKAAIQGGAEVLMRRPTSSWRAFRREMPSVQRPK